MKIKNRLSMNSFLTITALVLSVTFAGLHTRTYGQTMPTSRSNDQDVSSTKEEPISNCSEPLSESDDSSIDGDKGSDLVRKLHFPPVSDLNSIDQEWLREIRKRRISEADRDNFDPNSLPDFPDQSTSRDKFHWKPALVQSGLFLGIKHGVRLFQRKTYTELGGPFFRDWGNSIKNLRGWNDGDNPFTNNFAHPLQGSVTGWIFINNSDKAKKQEFGRSKEYWRSRLKAFAWSTVWSTQFEFGPVSEATIGNVGLRQKNGHSTMAWTDLVLTPVVGTAIVVEEDIVDKYILKNWIERRSNGVTTRVKILRSVLTPTASFSNLIRGKYPWKRDSR